MPITPEDIQQTDLMLNVVLDSRRGKLQTNIRNIDINTNDILVKKLNEGTDDQGSVGINGHQAEGGASSSVAHS